MLLLESESGLDPLVLLHRALQRVQLFLALPGWLQQLFRLLLLIESGFLPLVFGSHYGLQPSLKFLLLHQARLELQFTSIPLLEVLALYFGLNGSHLPVQPFLVSELCLDAYSFFCPHVDVLFRQFEIVVAAPSQRRLAKVVFEN